MAESSIITGGDISAAAGVSATSAAPASPAGLAPSQPATPPGAKGSETDDGTTPGTPPGPIPFDRHKAILENARTKHAEELRQVEWAKAHRREDVERNAQWYERANRDPFGFYDGMKRMLETHPQFAAEFKRRYSPPSNGNQPAADIDVPPDYQGPNGEPVYSQQAMLRREQVLREKILAEVDQRVAGKFAPVEQLQTEVARTKFEAKARDEVGRILKEAETWEGFAELKESIQKRMAADRRLSLEGAYNRAYREEWVPKLKEKTRQETLASLNEKAHATTERSSGVTVGAKADRDKSFAELLQERVKS